MTCSRSPSPPTTSAATTPPRPARSADAELLEQIRRHPHRVQGHLWRPADPQELLHRHVACGKRKVTRLMRQAGLEGRCKKRWRKTTVADPDAEAARDLIQRHFGPGEEIGPALCRRHHLHRDLGGLGLPGDSHRPGVSPRRRLGAGRSHAHRAGRRRSHHGLRQPGTTRRASSFIRTAAASTRAVTSPSWPGQRRRALGRTQGRMLG